MAIVEGSAHFVVTDAVRERIAAADRREVREFTVGELAESICRAFCGPRGLARGLNAVQLDIHRRQHVEIARAIFEQRGA